MTTIKNLKKPLSAFQYYIQEWKKLTDEEKEKFQQMALLDKHMIMKKMKFFENKKKKF